jgi:DNA modification methylase
MGWGIKDTKRIAGHSEKSGCHWFDKSQWSMPTDAVYKAWQQAAEGKAFKREYDDIKREYDDIKREYDDIKREWYATRAYFDNTHDNMTDVWNYPRVKGEERWGHATPKPVEMMQRIYKSSCPANGLIYSPFLGSGSDLIAAEQLGDRTVIGFELSEKYCSIICDRFSKLTGIEPEKVGELPNK